MRLVIQLSAMPQDCGGILGWKHQHMSTPGVEPGLSRPRRDVLTTRRCGLIPHKNLMLAPCPLTALIIPSVMGSAPRSALHRYSTPSFFSLIHRHRGDSNPCGQSPMDFESISLAARTQCHCLGFMSATDPAMLSFGNWQLQFVSYLIISSNQASSPGRPGEAKYPNQLDYSGDRLEVPPT